MNRPGWRYVGRVAGIDGFEIALCLDEHGIKRGDVIAFSAGPHLQMRPGTVQVASVGYDWFMTNDMPSSGVPTLADTDYVFVATALGENVFKRGEP